MAISRRALMGTLGASVLGAGALSGCGEGGLTVHVVAFFDVVELGAL